MQSSVRESKCSWTPVLDNCLCQISPPPPSLINGESPLPAVYTCL